MTRELLLLCPRMISMLEGGYDLESLKESVLYHVNAMQ